MAPGGLVGSSLYTTVTNSYYDADRVAINGSYTLGKGALAHDQFQDWFGNGLRLDIADYSASLVRDASTDTYLIGNLQGLRDLLGFATVGGANARSATRKQGPGAHFRRRFRVGHVASPCDRRYVTLSLLCTHL